MSGCFFSLGFLLWFAIKGFFKLFGLIVSFPFRLIKKSHDKKIRLYEEAQKQEEKNRKIEQDQQIVEFLFQKIIRDIPLNNNIAFWPDKIIIYNSFLVLFFNNGTQKNLDYHNYGSEDLRIYGSYWCTDGSKSDYVVNQEMLLAKKINAFAGDLYYVNDIVSKSTSELPDGIIMYHHIQQFVEMKKKSNNLE